MTIRQIDAETTKKIVKGVPLFARFSDHELSQLIERSRVRRYGRDETIVMADDENKQMYIILKGRVKIVEISINGEERVMAFRHRGDYFGEMCILDGKSDSATVIATEPCNVLLVTKSVFDEFFMENCQALQQIIAVLCGRLRESWIFNDIVGSFDAESKIMATLAHYGNLFGHSNSHGVIINSVFSHQSIADRVQIKRETVTRILKKMREKDEIEMVGRHIKLLPLFYEKFKQSKFNKVHVQG